MPTDRSAAPAASGQSKSIGQTLCVLIMQSGRLVGRRTLLRYRPVFARPVGAGRRAAGQWQRPLQGNGPVAQPAGRSAWQTERQPPNQSGANPYEMNESKLSNKRANGPPGRICIKLAATKVTKVTKAGQVAPERHLGPKPSSGWPKIRHRAKFD